MISTLSSPVGIPAHQPRARGRGDLLLSVLGVALTIFGVVVIYSATRGPEGDVSFALRQGAFLVIGIVAMAAVSQLDYRKLRALAPLVVVVTLVILAAVLSPLGSEIRGTRGWLRLGGLAVQPAELAKLTVIVALAALLTSRDRIVDRSPFVVIRLAASFGVIGMVGVMVLAGGETGSVLVYLAIGFGLFVLAGIPKRVLAVLLVAAVIGVVFVISAGVLEPYQQDRLEAFVDLDADPLGSGYNQQQSLTAIGSGGIFGKGLFNGPQTQLRYLPEQQTDFIFAVVSEELGFLGAIGLLLSQGLILARILRVMNATGDPFGALVCGGVFSYLAFQVFQNVAMNVRLLPVAGLPLPFVSYGGSALVTTFVALGLVQGVSARSDGTTSQLGPRHRSQQFWALTNCGTGRVSGDRVR